MTSKDNHHRKEFKKIVVCLSHEVTDSNNLSYDSKRRIDFACKLFKDDKCDVLITTGWKYRRDMKNSLAKVMADRAKKIHKIPDSKIILETSSKDTVGEAVFIRKILRSSDIKKIKVVTSDWHLNRAKEIFDFVFFNESFSIEFKTIKGTKKSARTERKNNSIEIFRDTFLPLQERSLESIYNRMIDSHKLYSD